jgi:hypothetical protein
MSNEWYNSAGVPQTGASGASLDVRAELALISAAFDKLPPLSTNASKIVQINSGGTALTALSYATGAWTPALTFATPGDFATTYSLQSGNYVRIGAFVLLSWVISTATFTHTTAAGNLIITGQPFTAYGIDSCRATGPVTVNYTKATYTQIMAVMNLGTGIRFGAVGTGVATGTLDAADLPTGVNLIMYGCIAYRTGDA